MEKELNIKNLILAVAAVITCVVGIMIHLFMVTVNVSDWVRGQPVTTTDQILTLIGITRMIYEIVAIIEIFFYTFLHVTTLFIDIVASIQPFLYYTSNCFSSLLFVVYCLKISNFHNAVFLHLKMIVLQRIVHLIIACVLLSICYTLQYFFIIKDDFYKSPSNETYTQRIHLYWCIFVLWNMIPLFVLLISTVFLLSSLCLHIHQKRDGRTVAGHLDTYKKTMKFLSCTFCIYFVYFVSTEIIVFHIHLLELACLYLFANIFPTLHSIYLIYVSAKLKDRFSGIIQHGINCLINKKHTWPKSEDLVEE